VPDLTSIETREDVLRAFSVSRETIERLDTIERVLREWSGRYNLVGPRELTILWPRHIADSLQLLPFLAGATTIVDLGSGAGFPGLVIAAAHGELKRITLIESVGKKARFLSAAAREANLPVEVLNQRIEAVETRKVPAQAVTARALSPLPSLLELSAPWLESGAFGVFPKGQRWEEELTAAREKWTFRSEVEVSRTSPEARILTISEVRGRL